MNAESVLESPAAEPSHPTGENNLLKPTTASDRIEVIDSLRGFAILGIVLVNILYFSMPIFSMMETTPMHPGVGNEIAEWFIRFFAESKFYSLFSLLFGLGAGVLYDRVTAKGRPFARFYSRRLLVLLGIGIFHAVVLWSGDILVLYALLGFILIAFESAKPRTMLIWFFVLVLIPVLVSALGVGAVALWKMAPGGAEAAAKTFGAQQDLFRKLGAEALAAYSGTDWVAMLKARLRDLGFMYRGIFYFGWSVLAMFVLGLWFWRTRRFQDLDNNQPFFRKLMWVCLVLGLAGNWAYALYRGQSNPAIPSFNSLRAAVSIAVGAPSMCLFYLSLFARLATTGWGRKLIHPFAAVGRTALSNYLFQTLVFTTIFYGYGFGLFGKVGPAAGLAMVVPVYVIQVLISNWWVKRFRFGPVEWLWRSLTYGKRQPMRLG